ncbi:HD domain-containing phosphohydrolase [Deinococcus sp.]|uniref:HD domain-containing phosphohydrolase n=1 Tax=Deinococcus sp. TaxID=47478 RepID=UPI003C79736A
MSNLQIEALNNLGCFYENVDEWRQAIHHHGQARELAQSIDYAEGQLNAVLNLGRVNVDHGDPLQAAEQLHEALRLATSLERPKSRRDAHQHLARLYKQAGQLALALEHFEAFHAEEQELFSTERDKTTRTLMMQFDVERAQTQTRAEREQREHAETLQARAEQQVRERTADLEQAQMEVVGRLAMAAEFRDDVTGEHTRRVGIGAALIAESLGLSREFTETIQIAARLHDVGKIGIPDAILLKAGKLSVAEFEEMKRHTLIGARLLSGGKSEVLNMARQIALTHHERWDGNGYPHGLTGPEIPLVGRIVALADVFDALLHKRPYKSAWEKAEALAELARQRGRHFDPELTDAALLVFGSGRYEAALLNEQPASPPTPPSRHTEVAHWELEAMRLQYEQTLESRTRELETARYQAEVQVEQFRQAAFTDVLTGLHNRRAFETDLLVFAEQARQDERPLGVISIDLDDLKHINDSGGHASGDALIVSVARQLQRHFEPGGRVYRMGGDEYAVLLWTDPELVAATLASEIGRLETELACQGHQTSLSVGYAHWPRDTDQPEELLRLSDDRMYAHKRRRKRALPLPALTPG